MKRKFNYLEKVIVLSNSETMGLTINGLSGTILGYDLIDGKWIYSVDIDQKEEIYSVHEKSLKSLGIIGEENQFY